MPKVCIEVIIDGNLVFEHDRRGGVFILVIIEMLYLGKMTFAQGDPASIWETVA